MKPLIDLENNFIDNITDILRKHLPINTEVFLFGSRTTGHAKPFSDIDILIDAGQPLTIQQLTLLHNAFDESLLPYKVDIVDNHSISSEFKFSIQNQLVPFPING